MKKIICIFLCVFMLMPHAFAAGFAGEVNAVSCVLMEAKTGKILYAKNENESLPPASVTKIMTILLIVEAIDSGAISLDDIVQISENAANKGGSQVFLAPGEAMSVKDLLKSIVVASANDAATALAEYVAGSEENFVAKMNDRARELDMRSTSFENPTGLDDTTKNHKTSAYDIALMSRELLSHEMIFEYTSIWQDTIRNGEFTLTNTNRLIRFYNGANGLKTGSTSKAKFCISATAKRDGMQLIAVIMGSPTRDTRNELAKALLDFGFANYSFYDYPNENLGKIKVTGGINTECAVSSHSFSALLNKGDAKKIKSEIILPESACAPINKGDKLGEIIFTCDGKEIGRCDIIAEDNVDKISVFSLFGKMVKYFFNGLC